MNLLESLRTAAGGLTTNRLRTALTMLGIIIGVAAVVTLMSVGEGVQAMVTGEIEGIGSNLLFITAEQGDDGAAPATLTSADADALSDPLYTPALAAVAPEVRGTLRVTRGDQAAELTVTGTGSRYAAVRSLEMAMGGFLTQADLDEQARVAVLGWEAYTGLFPEGDYPIDEKITIKGITFQVVGVAQAKGGLGPLGSDDERIYVPLTTAQARLFPQRTLSGERPVAVIYASAGDAGQVAAATDQIQALLRERHGLAPGEEDDFQIISQSDVLDVANQITGVLTLFLGAIAGISLLVGGIGIMNIMLVSVTERTREVGLRKAVGACRRDVLLQFLLEAMVLSFAGGLLGIALGAAGAQFITNLSPDLATRVTLPTVALASGVAGAIGLVFGVYPALRAANLHPIEALRYE